MPRHSANLRWGWLGNIARCDGGGPDHQPKSASAAGAELVSTTRWWAPQRASMDLDQVVLALLTPEDEGTDLQATLLAAHRAGAAACEFVAKGGLTSEQALASALTEARAKVAGPAVDAVAKSMSPSYAGLLMRDLLDDAEDAAMNLYRSRSPRASRPRWRPIGWVRSTASRPESSASTGRSPSSQDSAPTLADTADEVLLGYVAKVAEEERGAPGPAEEVGKAPVPHPDSGEEWDEREHPRDARGRFTDGPRIRRAPTSGPRPGAARRCSTPSPSGLRRPTSVLPRGRWRGCARSSGSGRPRRRGGWQRRPARAGPDARAASARERRRQVPKSRPMRETPPGAAATDSDPRAIPVRDRTPIRARPGCPPAHRRAPQQPHARVGRERSPTDLAVRRWSPVPSDRPRSCCKLADARGQGALGRPRQAGGFVVRRGASTRSSAR